MQRNVRDKSLKTEEREYFFPVYGGEAKVVWATSQEEANQKFTQGETTPAPLQEEVTIDNHG